MNIHKKFEKVNNEYTRFENVENKRSNRPDIHAFILLDELFPDESGANLIHAAEHDEFYIDVGGGQLETLTDEQILELTRCGVMYDPEYNCLMMFP